MGKIIISPRRFITYAIRIMKLQSEVNIKVHSMLITQLKLMFKVTEKHTHSQQIKGFALARCGFIILGEFLLEQRNFNKKMYTRSMPIISQTLKNV